MPSSTPPRWQRSKTKLFLAAAFAAATPVAALDLASQYQAEPHLSPLPRTDAERTRIEAVTAPATDFSASERFEDLPAGAATVRAREDDEAFSQHSANLSFEQELEFKLGNGLFKKIWVFSPSSTKASDGLGPLYNARSCQRCHLKDGRGHVVAQPDYASTTMFLRVSIPGPVPAELQEVHDYIGTAPDPKYGSQLQDFSAPGIAPEYKLQVEYEEFEVALNGGETATLRRPGYTAANLGYGPLADGAMLSPRVAPPMIGLGLLEAIPAADILAHADEEDTDGDGISGRANLVWSREFNRVMLGRFGLKAGMPTVHEQSAGAFSGDIGISTPLFPAHAGECTDLQTACQYAPHGGADSRETEIDQPNMDLVTFYSRNLGVPARRNTSDAQVLRGKQVFYNTGCASCHVPKYVTHRLQDRPEQSFQLIWPYSDLLLHDMGEGLADNRPEARATGREWRTAPLWGIGLTQQVSPRATFLHDGRARTLLEAILWHGGEAEAAKTRVVKLRPEDRAALIAFLESL
ncbi:di-heme oxidoredictase family protein [Leisingera sp. MMG026]|uniref:di-heme oxidoreductase family protein n=1 Tax=Leisingera sp. MMG026 TaxID=2909982 RepID=UPI001F02EB0B|nr:di-heme oxidoredictase family protein [Leisingera sp. MMG026]MCF6431872.1 c-type cytochrome [Leisingera sp. MMG026]